MPCARPYAGSERWIFTSRPWRVGPTPRGQQAGAHGSRDGSRAVAGSAESGSADDVAVGELVEIHRLMVARRTPPALRACGQW
ncbi:hypothetical protein ASE25_14100 [Terrabacter sp. Root85]|nr:hypothetical protein ASE25_14100 [Terrabacter sp. Root85]